jgi:hypothetical protein
MQRITACTCAALIFTALSASGCGSSSSKDDQGTQPVKVTRIAGTPFTRVELSAAADARIGVQTTRAVNRTSPSGAREVAVPYGAILYDANGVPSVFTNPDPRVYIRHPVRVDRISGPVAYLKKGLAAGEPVVTVGGDELYGAETGVQGEER